MWHPVPFIPPHREDTEMQGAYQQSRTKGSLLVGGREGRGSGVDGGELQLRWGHFSPVIALCGTSPGGTMTAVEGGGGIIWYIVREALGQNAKHSWWKSDILFKDHVGDTQKPAPAFPKPDSKFTVYFPRWRCDLLKDVELKLLSICDVRFFSATACTWST